MSRRAFKFRLYPNKTQSESLDRTLHLLRDFYNAALQERRDAWTLNRVRVTCFDQINQIPEIRNELNTDYQALPVTPIKQCLRRLDKAFNAFFRRTKTGKRAGYPRFKGRNAFNSIIYNGQGFRLVGSRLRLSYLGDLKIKLSRPIEGKIKEVIAKREGGKWFAVISCDGVPERRPPATEHVVGLDAGIESFITLSDGAQIDNPRFYESTQKRLRKGSTKTVPPNEILEPMEESGKVRC